MKHSAFPLATYTYYGAFRAIAQAPDRQVVSDARDMQAHFNDEGDLRLIGQYQNAHVEVVLSYFDIERLYRQATRRRLSEESAKEEDAHDSV